MIEQNTISLLATLLLLVSLPLANCTTARSDVPTITFCQLVSHPDQFNNKIVRTEAVFHVNLESQVLYNPSCYSEDKTMWVEFSNSYTYSNDEIKNTFDRLLCQTKPCPTRSVRVTVVGRFERTSDVDYDHLNGYQLNFEVLRIEKVEAVAKSQDVR